MSDYDDDDLETTEQTNDKGWRKRMVAEAEERGRNEAAAETNAAKRELAFIKAGIDLDSPGGKLLSKAYDGANTVEAIKAAAVEYGVIQSEAPAVPAEELAAHDRVANASAGATSPNEADELMAELDKAGDFFNGGSPDAVLAVLRKAGIGAEYTRPGNWQKADAAQPLT